MRAPILPLNGDHIFQDTDGEKNPAKHRQQNAMHFCFHGPIMRFFSTKKQDQKVVRDTEIVFIFGNLTLPAPKCHPQEIRP